MADSIFKHTLKGNRLEISVTRPTPDGTYLSDKYPINAIMLCQFKIDQNQLNFTLSVKFEKRLGSKNKALYMLSFICPKLYLCSKLVSICNESDEDTWHPLKTHKSYVSQLHLTVVVEIVTDTGLALLYDGFMTDFELRGDDGGVHVHRNILAVSSPVLRTMLSQEWREVQQGHVDLPAVSSDTLQHFKDYIYLRKVPDTGLEELLKLAVYYMMPELEQECIGRLVATLSEENVLDMIMFAAKFNLSRLILNIVVSVNYGALNIMQMYETFEKAEAQKVEDPKNDDEQKDKN